MKKVVLAYPYTDDKGKEHAPDETVSLPDDVANDRVHWGYARWPEDDSPDKRNPKKGEETAAPADPAAAPNIVVDTEKKG